MPTLNEKPKRRRGKRSQELLPQNKFFAARFREALKDKDWIQADLVRELEKRGLYKQAKTPVSNWYKGKTQPARKYMEEVAALLGKPRAYFDDPQYHADLWVHAGRRLMSLLHEAMAERVDVVELMEQQSGNPRQFDRTDRQLLSANQQTIWDLFYRRAPGAWAALSVAQRLEVIQAALDLKPPERRDGHEP